MKNLAGVEGKDANLLVQGELEAAAISMVPVDPGRGEVRATMGGVLEVGGYTIRLVRRWVYWSAEVVQMPNQPEDRPPHLPSHLAMALNGAPYAGGMTRYSGHGAHLGSVVRADGYAGGQPSSALAGGVRIWHIDTLDGLVAFAQWCREHLRQPESV